MEIEIRRLTPGLADDYARFFDTTPHGSQTEEDTCYCVTWRNDDTYAGDDHWYPTREERRARALQFVKDGCIQGYLAYHGNNIVGWCNTNASCQKGVDYLRTLWPIEDHRADVKVKPIFCFAIAPQAQRMGVATRLVQRICQDAAADGFDYVEAYANRHFTDPPNEMRGPLAMYKKCGFTPCAEREGKVVVRRALK